MVYPAQSGSEGCSPKMCAHEEKDDEEVEVQGYLAHKKTPTSLGFP